MSVTHAMSDSLVQFVKDDDSAALKFVLRWERDRRRYLHHRYNDGLTLLHQACLLGKRKVVHVLVECGCDIEGRSSVGWTALHAAALSGCYDVVAYLVNTCASNVAAEDDMGCRPIDLTLEPQITSFLHNKVKELNARTAQEKKNFRKVLQTSILVDGKENQPIQPPQVTKSKRTLNGHQNANSRTNFLKYIRFREDEISKLSQQNKETINFSGSYQGLKVSQLKDYDSDRDSGIYEDFVDVSELTVRDDTLKKSCKRKVVSTRGKSTTV